MVKLTLANVEDESFLPTAQQSLVFRLLKRADIRRNIAHRKSVQEGAPDRLADLLEEAAAAIYTLQKNTTGMNDELPRTNPEADE